MGAPVWTPEKEIAFLSALADTANVSRACKAVEVARQTAYTRKAEDASFSERWDEALKLGVEGLEDEATRRAFEGVDEPVYHLGQSVGTVKKYSDTLAIFLLKAHKPAKYRERYDIAHSGGISLESLVSQAGKIADSE